MSHSAMYFTTRAVLSALLVLCSTFLAYADPIQRMQGVIEGVEEGYLWVRPEDRTALRKFILRWKAQFIPPKLPLKGDRVLILYKNKENGAVIYGLKYLGVPPHGIRRHDEGANPEKW